MPPAPQFKIEEVREACLAAMAELQVDLPPAIGARLKLQRVAQRHGTETRMFLYHVWDRHQPGLLDYHHFSYGVVYDPVLRYHDVPLLLRFYANKHRIYDKRNEVVPALWSEMKLAQTILVDFKAAENEQMIGLFRKFKASTVAALKDQIYQGFLEIMPYWHSRYAAVIDAYGTKLTAEEVAEVIAGRRKFQPSRPRSPVAVVDYCRHAPGRLRAVVFQRDGGRCVKCGSTDELHADHIRPVSLGGLTVLSNLQTLCAMHNLAKGNRESTDYRQAP